MLFIIELEYFKYTAECRFVINQTNEQNLSLRFYQIKHTHNLLNIFFIFFKSFTGLNTVRFFFFSRNSSRLLVRTFLLYQFFKPKKHTHDFGSYQKRKHRTHILNSRTHQPNQSFFLFNLKKNDNKIIIDSKS